MKHAKGGARGRKAKAPEAPSFSSSPPTGPEFERFVDFAREVVSVPRAILEERERVYRESRGLPPKKKGKEER